MVGGEIVIIYQDIIELWNDQADEWNQWDSLSEEEKVEFAYEMGVKEHDE